MPLSRCLLVAALPLSLCAQELIETPKFPQTAYFRQYFGRELPKIELQPPLRLDDFVVGDRLELSLRSYLDLVLANNTDIQIQRLTLEQPRNAITRAHAVFDPFINTFFRARRSNSPTNDVLAGAQTLSTLSQPFGINYNQRTESGTEYQVGYDGARNSTNNSFTTFNPSITGNLNLSFSQPLWRGRGSYIQKLPIMVARSRYRQSEYNMQDLLMQILQRAEVAYWAVIEARESLRVQEDGLRVADEFLKRNQRELQLGAISPLEIYQPQQNYASAEVRVTQARYRLRQTEDALRRQISADIDPQYRNMTIFLTETVLPPSDDSPLDKEYFVETAYQKRPDLKAQLQSLDIDDLNYQQAKNNLKPDVSLTGLYTATGRGGNFLERTNVFGTGSTVQRIIPGGLGDALNQVFAFDFPIYQFGLNLRLPLRDRRSQADLADAVVSKRINGLRARSIEQQIRLEVLNAVTQVENSRASVRLAQVQLDYSTKRLEAEQKRYDLGVTTIFFVLDAQNALTNAQAQLVQSSVQYRRDLLNLLRVTGQLLEERGVSMQ